MIKSILALACLTLCAQPPSGSVFPAAIKLSGYKVTPTEVDFTLAILGDPQNMATNCPAAYAGMAKWIVTNQASYGGLDLNIKAAIGVGDVINLPGSPNEENAANTAYGVLNAGGIPFVAPPGNHDYANFARNTVWAGFTTGMFNVASRSAFFGTGLALPGSGGGTGYWGGGYDTSGANTYIRLMVGTEKLLIFGLELFPRVAVLNWAANIAASYSDHIVIISTHGYITDTGALVPRIGGWGPEYYNSGGSMTYPNGTSGVEMWGGGAGWAGFKTIPNLHWVVNGHWILGSSYLTRSAQAAKTGQTVSQLFANWQGLDVGSCGDGVANSAHIALLKIRPSINKVEVYAVSTNSGKWMSGADRATASDTPVKIYAVTWP